MPKLRQLFAVAAFAIALAAADEALAREPDATPLLVLPVRLHIAYGIDRPALDAWIDAQISETNRVLRCGGVHVVVASRDALSDVSERTIDDRAAFTATGHRSRDDEGLDVFVVRSLFRRWRGMSDAAGVGAPPGAFEHAGFVAVVQDANPVLLAHEVGHFLGLEHSRDRRNLMAHGGDRGDQLAPGQCERLRSAAMVRARVAHP